MQQASRLALRYDPPDAARGAAAANANANAAGSTGAGGTAARAAEAQYNPVARRAAGLAQQPPRGDSDSDAEEELSADERQARFAARRVATRPSAALTRGRHPQAAHMRAWYHRLARMQQARRFAARVAARGAWCSRTVSRLTRRRRGRRRKRTSCGGSSTRSTAFAPKGAPRHAVTAALHTRPPVVSRARLLSRPTRPARRRARREAVAAEMDAIRAGMEREEARRRAESGEDAEDDAERCVPSFFYSNFLYNASAERALLMPACAQRRAARKSGVRCACRCTGCISAGRRRCVGAARGRLGCIRGGPSRDADAGQRAMAAEQRGAAGCACSRGGARQ